MKTTHCFLFLIGAWLLTQSPMAIQAQPCELPPRIMSFSRFSKGVTVQVTIDTQFTPDERQSIENAFLNWNAHSVSDCSNVTFGGFGYGTPPPSSSNNVTFVRFDSSTPSCCAATKSMSVGTCNAMPHHHLWLYQEWKHLEPALLRRSNETRDRAFF